jgi:hypothetical protein
MALSVPLSTVRWLGLIIAGKPIPGEFPLPVAVSVPVPLMVTFENVLISKAANAEFGVPVYVKALLPMRFSLTLELLTTVMMVFVLEIVKLSSVTVALFCISMI